MIKIEKEGKIIRIDTSQLRGLEQMQDFLTEMEKLLQQPDTFALLFHNEMDEKEMKEAHKNKEANKLQRNWMKENRERIAMRCLAVAMVVKPSVMMRAMKPMAGVQIKRSMGVEAGQMFFDYTKAEAWLEKQINSI